jgi:hypothetical protein
MNISLKNTKKTVPAIVLIIFLCVPVLFNNCSQDFLKPTPLSFYVPAATFTTESGVQAVLAQCDKNLTQTWTGYASGNVNTNPIGSDYIFSDVMAYGKTDEPLNNSCYVPATALTPTSGDGNADNTNQMMIRYFWDEGYKGIMYANSVTTYIDQITGLDEATKNTYIGQAYFHRAIRYYQLVFHFGDVPLITKVASGPKFDYRTTKKEAILNMLVQDMEFAVQWVPDQKDMAYIGKVNKGACRMLLIKLYLATGQWQKAKDQADILIDQSGYSLMQNNFGSFIPGGEPRTWPITENVIWDLHRSENKVSTANKEAIFTMVNQGTTSFFPWLSIRVYGPYLNAGAPNLVTPDGKAAWAGITRNTTSTTQPYNAAYDWPRAFGRGIGVYRPTSFAQHSLWVMNGVEDTTDLRHNSKVGNWIRMTDLTYNDPTSAYFGQHYMLHHPTTGVLLCRDTIRDWYDWAHYKMWYRDVGAEANPGSNDFRGATAGSTGGNGNLYLYRLAETYLLRAEAEFYMGNIAGATADVNVLRQRAKSDQLYTSVTIGDIMNERARELLMEEWRNAEMKRVSLCLALSGKPDEWGNTYDVNTWDKQSGTDKSGGSYWWQRMCHYNNFYNAGPLTVAVGTINYVLDKHNNYWPIPSRAIVANTEALLHQNFGYDGYDASIPMWDNWQDAVADEK